MMNHTGDGENVPGVDSPESGAAGAGDGGNVYCTRCGAPNRIGWTFCTKCGNRLTVPGQPGMETGTGVERQTPAITERRPSPPVMPGMRAAPRWVTAQRAELAAARVAVPRAKRGRALLIGAALLLVAGMLVLISTWLAWGRETSSTISGWGWYDVGRIAVSRGGDIATPIFVYFQGYPIFTGLCSLVLGAMMCIAGMVMAIFSSRRVAGVAVSVSAVALVMALINLTSVLRQPDTGVGAGLILFIIFAAVGILGAIAGLRGSAKPATPTAAPIEMSAAPVASAPSTEGGPTSTSWK